MCSLQEFDHRIWLQVGLEGILLSVKSNILFTIGRRHAAAFDNLSEDRSLGYAI